VASDELFGWEKGESWWVMTPLLMVASPQKKSVEQDHFESQELTCKIIILS